ncbi:MAG: ChaN family lipoprotein [Cyanobacteria bacterium P01_A01_bin.114]
MPLITYRRAFWQTLSFAGVGMLVLGASACKSVTPPSETPVASVPQGLISDIAIVPTAVDDILNALATARVIYLGETHTDIADHTAQLEVVQTLHERGGDVAIGLEMFQRPFQGVLDQYLMGEITESEMLVQTEYETRWGYPWEFYQPIVRYAKDHQIPLIALNAPAEVTRKVAREGLASLTDEDLQHIPPLADIDTTDEAYKAFMADILGSHGGGHGGGPHSDFSLDNFFAAQVVWDETMAASIAEFAETNPDTQVIVLAGEGHIIYDFGIPSRVQRRLGEELIAHSVILNPSAQVLVEGEGEIADFFWVSE